VYGPALVVGSATRFPDGFLWGTATAAHQVEGANTHNDWWEWEHTPGSPCVESSGDAIDHWHRWPDDLALLAELGFGAYRFSLEWSRIEPAEGEFSLAALEHYRRMLAGCHEVGLVPVLTFHHFTSPRWAVADGAWESVRTAERLARFCERAVDHLGDLIGMAGTINEPNVVAWVGYLFGEFPPGLRDMAAFRRANDVMLRACRLTHAAIKGGRGDFPVGVTLSMHDYEALPGGEGHVAEARAMLEDEFLEQARGDDFLGVQCYTRLRFGPDGMVGPATGVPTTKMGYEFWPRCVEVAARRAAEVTGIPVYVTENGIATDDDAERIRYVAEALAGVRRCLDDGVDVRGYLYWSAFDNFEWARGYGPTFGLVGVDRTTFARHPKPSAKWLGEIARRNEVPGP